jgi:formate dehydrogenase major subunit
MSRYATWHLQFKPGSDVPMLNALLHTIIEEGLVDRQYVEANVEGFSELKAKVAGYSPEKMAPMCGIPAERLREVARTFARSRASIVFWGMGISQHVHGTDNARCLIALCMITGHVGRPGTGLHPLRGQNNVQGASDAGLIPMVFPDYLSVENVEIRERMEAFWGTRLDPKRGLTVVEIVNAVLAGQIRGMYIMGENPAMSDPDQHHARSALAKLEHLVVQDIFLTETAWHADVILPASAHAEKTGSYTNTNRQIQIGRPAIKLPGEARQDLDLIQEIAQRIGLPWTYAHPRDVFNEMAEVMPSLKNITWERLEREDSVTYPCDDPGKPGNEIIFASGFPTKSGRARLVPTELVPPGELPDADYPMVLSTGRLLEHWHTGVMTRRATVLDSIEPEAIALLNRRDLQRLGLWAGDKVRVSTRRGTIELTARLDRDVPEGMVFIPFCFAEAPANFLTNPQLDPFGKIPEFKFCAAKVEPAKAPAAAAE